MPLSKCVEGTRLYCSATKDLFKDTDQWHALEAVLGPNLHFILQYTSNGFSGPLRSGSIV